MAKIEGKCKEVIENTEWVAIATCQKGLFQEDCEDSPHSEASFMI